MEVYHIDLVLKIHRYEICKELSYHKRYIYTRVGRLLGKLIV